MFSSKSAGFAGSPTQLRVFLTLLHPLKLTSLGAAARTSPTATARRRALRIRIARVHQTPPKLPKQHTASTLRNTPRVRTNRITAGDPSSSACRSGSRACAVPAAPHFLPRRLRSPEKHLSRCHEKRLVRTRCVNRSDRFRVRGFA